MVQEKGVHWNILVPIRERTSILALGTPLFPCQYMRSTRFRPWALPKPTREKLPLDPLQKAPPTPSLFEGAPSPVGRQKQKFLQCREGSGLAKFINFLNSFPLVSQTFTVDECHVFRSAARQLLDEKKDRQIDDLIVQQTHPLME